MPLRTAVAMMAGMVGWYLHLVARVVVAAYTVPILDNRASFRQG